MLSVISIVLATFNGASTLPTTLDAFCRLRTPKCGFEMIAVDNASTDETRAILEDYRDRLALTIVQEPAPGKSNAMNSGIRYARGSLVLFTDDDVIPSPDWVCAYADAAEAHPDVDIFAGQVRHFWQKTPPEWLERLGAEGEAYGGTAIDRPAGPIEPHFIKGANFLVRSRLLREHKFRADIGYGAGGDMVAGEETYFAQKAFEARHKLRYVPQACVRHIVRRHQIGYWPVFQRYFRIGRGLEAISNHRLSEDTTTLFGFPRFLLRELPMDLLKCLSLILRGKGYEGARSLMDLAMTVGRAYQWKISRNS